MRPSRTNPSEAARRLAARSGRRTALLVAAALCALGMKPRDAPEYGSVLLDRRASRAGVPPVTFDHWRHRARFSCRVCHVDVGFAMARGGDPGLATRHREPDVHVTHPTAEPGAV